VSLPFGGDAGPGLAIELCPLAELELFLLRPFLSLARCMLAKLGCPPGENRVGQMPLLPAFNPGNRVLAFACGVMIIGSSWSSGSNGSTSSEELLESSEPIMLMLPTELEGAVLSPWLHPPCMLTFGESSSIEFERGFRGGILIPFCVIVGEESGEDWAGSVEWWRFVQALENSAPRDRRGSIEAGEPSEAEAYVLRASSCGDRGTRAAKCAGLGIGDSRAGIWRERPLERKSGLRGVLGLAMVWSSLDMRAGSRNFGEGSSRGVLSLRDRAFGDFDFWGVVKG
jgi:hypothetical protein